MFLQAIVKLMKKDEMTEMSSCSIVEFFHWVKRASELQSFEYAAARVWYLLLLSREVLMFMMLFAQLTADLLMQIANPCPIFIFISPWME